MRCLDRETPAVRLVVLQRIHPAGQWCLRRPGSSPCKPRTAQLGAAPAVLLDYSGGGHSLPDTCLTQWSQIWAQSGFPNAGM